MGRRNLLPWCFISAVQNSSVPSTKLSDLSSNGIFAKIGRLASEEVMVQLFKEKRLPILLYALDVCNLDKRSMQSLDFTFNRFFMKLKLFKTSNMEIVNYCRRLFGCDLPSTLLKPHFDKFITSL